MYAAVCSNGAPVPELAALRYEPGFAGALSLLDVPRARILVVVFWETEEQARALAGRGCGEVWEVTARV